MDTDGHTHTHTHGTWNSAIPTMGFGIAEVFAKKSGHWLVTGQYSMTPGLVEWYQSTCSLDHAEGVSHYATCFSVTTFVDERRSSVVNDQATAIFDVEFDVQLVLP